MFAITALLVAQPINARPTDRAEIRQVIAHFFNGLIGRDRVWIYDSVWPNACYDVGRNVCQDLRDVQFGQTSDRWVANDMRIWVAGNRAVVSIHSSEFLYDPFGELRDRDICSRTFKLQKRKNAWRISRMYHVQCKRVDGQ